MVVMSDEATSKRTVSTTRKIASDTHTPSSRSRPCSQTIRPTVHVASVDRGRQSRSRKREIDVASRDAARFAADQLSDAWEELTQTANLLIELGILERDVCPEVSRQ